MKIVHAADLHLDSPMRGLARYDGAPVEAMTDATRRAFENLVRLCLAERASALLLAGDLFDGDWRDYHTGVWFTRALAPLAEAGIPVVAVRGNHDAASEVTRHLRWPAHLHLFGHDAPSTWIDERAGLAVHGMSYPRRDVPDDLVPRYPEPRAGLFNVGLLHTNVGGRPGHADYAPTSLPVLQGKGYGYWALGHVHEPAVLAEAPWVVYPGNLQGRNIRETGARGAVVIEVDPARAEVRSVRREVLDVARWERVELTLGEADDVEALYARVHGEVGRVVDDAGGRTVAVRLVVRGATRAHAEIRRDPERVEAELRVRAAGASAWVEKVRFHTRLPGERTADGGLRAALDAELAALAADPEALAALLRDDLPALQRLLPALRRQEAEGDDADDVRPQDAAWLAGLLPAVGDALAGVLEEGRA